ncbi:response regulator transcription factor [Ralstonia solanacearum]|uniref:Response regulator transcription factor n=3 Tax=Ralstonia solanacearum TaxID=305 RepID=A0AAW5ZRT9_RALSL|nr:response regulator transcription factor [Ralstonia solanacearum]MDB0510533.1 response regulator transcription factor [Ralstonia solanacearum]MDB0515038.1 response regulator transcription factor [Ralstonia solanacearum]MDB0528729.1 response regulator transcription factor [Ralstonia solanacearum]MDB0567529.1 response regulator transcription factor [Ralstonia solanacearum]MDB0571905.1 response regulator transcription factor [Ralstonia solanacearum]
MRILLIEDDRAIASGIHAGLTQAGHRVLAVHDGVFAVEHLARQSHDLVILDLGLPGIDGMTLLSQYRARDRGTPVLILTARDSLQNKVDGLNAGADDYLLKPFEMLELVARVQALLRRRGDNGEPMPRPDIVVGRLRMSGAERRIFVDAAALELSPREFAVLELLMLRQGRVVSKVQLQDHLASFGHALGEAGHDVVGDTAIEVYVHRVRRKIEQTEAEIVTVRGFGYLLQARAAP